MPGTGGFQGDNEKVFLRKKDRICKPYGIPELRCVDTPGLCNPLDVIYVTPNYKTPMTCPLEDQFYLEDLSNAGGPVSCNAVFSHYIQDPNTNPETSIPFWMGAPISQEFSFVYLKVDLNPTLNLGSQGLTPVTIFGALIFDVTTINPNSLTLTGNSPGSLPTDPSCLAHWAYADLNGDGFPDMQIQFSTQGDNCLAGRLTTADTVVTLKGKTYGGAEVSGSDTVRIIK